MARQDDDTEKCRKCGAKLNCLNAIDVGYCIPCYNLMMVDGDSEDDSKYDINYDLHEGRGEGNELL